MNSMLYLGAHLVILVSSVLFKAKRTDFYSILYDIARIKALHLLHTTFITHIFLSFSFFVSDTCLGKLSDSEFAIYCDKATAAISDILMMVTMFSQELVLQSIIGLGILYAFKSFYWTLKVKSQRSVNKNMILSSLGVELCAIMMIVYYKVNYTFLSELFCLEYTLLVLSAVKCTLIMSMDHFLQIEGRRSQNTFLIGLSILFLKSLAFFIFVLQFTKKSRFPYSVFRSFLTTLHKFYKKLILFRKYLKLLKNLSKIKEVDIDGVCVICTDELKKGKKLRCGHIFHSSCLNLWCEREISCPICRSELVFKNEKIETDNEIIEGVSVELEDE